MLSACVITLNEEKNLATCLESVKFADEIIIVDSGSTDNTVEIAKCYTDKIYTHPFRDFSRQKNYAIEKASGDWILSIDADEQVTGALKEQIKRAVKTKMDGFYIKRFNYHYGQMCLADYHLRLFKREHRFRGAVHEKVCFTQLNATTKLSGTIIHQSLNTVKEHLKKADLYTRIEAENSPRGRFVMVLIAPPIKFLTELFNKGFRVALISMLVETLRRWRLFSKTKTWDSFYTKELTETDYQHILDIHTDFLTAISQPKNMLEVGTGTGALAISFAKNNVTSVDNNPKVLENARRNIKSETIKLVLADAFELPFENDSFDVAYSQGFFEHFTDENIGLLLKEQLRVAGKVFLSVPTKYYNSHDKGDERLLTKKKWEKILTDFNVVLSKYYCYQRCKRNLMRSLPMMYMAEVHK